MVFQQHCRCLRTTVVLCSLVAGSEATSFLRAGQVSEEDAARSLESELMAGSVGDARLRRLQDLLGPTYKALPKNAAGNLGHQAVRYVLHRLFVQQHGWFIRGLEASNHTSWHPEDKPATVKEWVPDFLQGFLEKRWGDRGTNLGELAAVAAALEDLVRKEATGRLQTAYEFHGLPLDQPVPEHLVQEAIDTYFVAYLKKGNFSAEDMMELHYKKQIFGRQYAGYREVTAWLNELVDRRMTPMRTGRLNFTAVSNIASEVGETFYAFNDMECRSLKKILQGLEGKKAGRVRLSAFYNASLYSHWRFNEKADYLKKLGALDDSDPQQPKVIVPNYVMSRPNCLEASNLYAVCCRNECEDLMARLEKTIGSSVADPAIIADLVAAIPSDTVTAPRNLSESLLDRLKQVARINFGHVPLHGRLFAQWMHHAYPRECPYPHEVGTTRPQTPDEWMEETGYQMATASEEEMKKQVASDTCASDTLPVDTSCGDETDELPWSEAEELLTAHVATTVPWLFGASGSYIARLSIVVLASVGVAVASLGSWHRLVHWGIKDGKPIAIPAHWLLVPLASTAMALYSFGLLDGKTFVLAVCVGLLVINVKQMTGQHLRRLLLQRSSPKLPY